MKPLTDAELSGDFMPFSDQSLKALDEEEFAGCTPFDENERELLGSIKIVAWPSVDSEDHETWDDADQCHAELCVFIYGSSVDGMHMKLTDMLKHNFDGDMFGKASEIAALTRLRDECDRLIAEIEARLEPEDDGDRK